MTEIQKTQILEMRQMGNTYKHIATTLFIPKGTVKSFCLRAEKKGLFAPHPQQENTLCKQCGKEIVQVEKRKRRIFCCKACCQKWWNSHLYLVSQSSKSLYHFTCPACGKSFTAYGNDKRKYCSHDCFIKTRYYKEGPSE